MFGQNQSPQNDNQIPDQSIDAAMSTDQNDQPSGVPAPSTWQHPGQPINDTASPVSNGVVSKNDQVEPVITPVTNDVPQSDDTPAQDSAPEPEQTIDSSHANDLLDIKQQALGQLSPLIDHLDQSPEEKFRTTMMMIQASDNQSLVRAAFETAQQIQDEKARAQALLDVINEINYFTQHQTPSA